MNDKYLRPLLRAAISTLYLITAYSVFFIQNINAARITGIAALSALALLAITYLFVYKTTKPNHYNKTPAHFNSGLIATYSIFLCCALIPEFNAFLQNQIFVNISFLLLTLGTICLDIYSLNKKNNKFTPHKLFKISQYILLIPLLCFPLSLHINPYVIAFMTILLIATTIGEFLTVYKQTPVNELQDSSRTVNQGPASSQEFNQLRGDPKNFNASGTGRTLNQIDGNPEEKFETFYRTQRVSSESLSSEPFIS